MGTDPSVRHASCKGVEIKNNDFPRTFAILSFIFEVFNPKQQEKAT